MLDIGGWELLIIVAIAIVVVGPKELPGALRTVVHWIRRARELTCEFQSGLDSFIQETELDQLKTGIETVIDPRKGFQQIGNSIKKEFEDALDPSADFFDDDENNRSIVEEDVALAEEDRMIAEEERRVAEAHLIEQDRASTAREEKVGEEDGGLAAEPEPSAPLPHRESSAGTDARAKPKDKLDESA